MSGFAEALIYIVQTRGSLYLLIVLLRFILQLVRADFYNPLSQFTVKATQPLLKPLRLQQPAAVPEVRKPLFQVLLDLADAGVQLVLGGGVVAGGEDHHVVHVPKRPAGHGVDLVSKMIRIDGKPMMIVVSEPGMYGSYFD